MPDAQPTPTGRGRACARVSPSTSNNPHHPRPWHKGSLFGDGPRRPLLSDERRLWLHRADAERRAGRLTLHYVEVGRCALKRLSVDGRCDPAHATLAADLGCSERTVRRALDALRALGLLRWERRLVRVPWPVGGAGAMRAEQTSNAYEFLLPDQPVAPPGPRPVRPVQLRLACGGQMGRETTSNMFPKELPMLTEAERQRLEAIQAARKERLAAEWIAQHAQRWRGMG